MEDFINGLTESIVEEMTNAYMATDEFKAELEAVKKQLLAASEAVKNAKTDEELAAATEQLKAVEEAAKGLYNGVDEATKAVRDLNKELEQDTSFTELADSFKSSLMDMDATAEDWGQEIGKTLANTIIEQMIVPTMIAPLLQNVEDALNAALAGLPRGGSTDDIGGGGATDWEAVLGDEALQKAIADMEEQYPVLKELIQKIMALAGVDMTPTFSNSLDNLADTLLDRLLSLDDDVEDIGKQIGSTLIREMLTEMLKTGVYADRIAAIRQLWQDILTGADTVHTWQDVVNEIARLEADLNDPDNAFAGLADAYKRLNEEVSGIETSFGDLRSTFLDSLMDMESGVDDFRNKLEQTLVKDMMEKMVLDVPLTVTIGDESIVFDSFDDYREEWEKRYLNIWNAENPKIRTTFFIVPKSMTIGDTLSWHRS